MQAFCCFPWVCTFYKKAVLYCLYLVAFVFFVGLTGPNLSLVSIIFYLFYRVYAKWLSYKRALLPIRQPSGNDLCLPIEVWQRVLSYCYGKESLEKSMFDVGQCRLRINCYNDKLQLNTLRCLSCLNLDYYWSAKNLWAAIEYLPRDMRISDNTLPRLKNMKFLDLTKIWIDDKTSITRFTHITGLKISTGNHLKLYLDNYRSRVEELNISNAYTLTNESIQDMTQLKSLICYSNRKIDEETLSRLTNLTHLEMDVNEKLGDGSFFHSLTKLDILKLDLIHPTFDYTNLLCLTQLHELTLCSCHLPDGVLSGFYCLQSLSLEYNRTITDSHITTLVSLTSLSLYNCTHIHGSCFSRIQSLTRLKLECSRESEFGYSEHFRHATNLRILSITANIPEPKGAFNVAYDYMFYPLGQLCSPGNYTQLRQLTYLNLPTQKVLHKDNIRELTQLSKLMFFNNELLKPVEKKKKRWF